MPFDGRGGGLGTVAEPGQQVLDAVGRTHGHLRCAHPPMIDGALVRKSRTPAQSGIRAIRAMMVSGWSACCDVLAAARLAEEPAGRLGLLRHHAVDPGHGHPPAQHEHVGWLRAVSMVTADRGVRLQRGQAPGRPGDPQRRAAHEGGHDQLLAGPDVPGGHDPRRPVECDVPEPWPGWSRSGAASRCRWSAAGGFPLRNAHPGLRTTVVQRHPGTDDDVIVLSSRRSPPR